MLSVANAALEAVGAAFAFPNPINGFALGDTIDLTGVAFAVAGMAVVTAAGALEVVENGQTIALNLGGDFAAGSVFPLSSDGASGAGIVPCYLRVTRILTEGDGAPIQAERLMNGVTIFQDRTITRGEYFHVELAQHDVIVAEGVQAESYLDTGNRRAFAQSTVLHRMPPDFSAKPVDATCFPLALSGPVLRAVRARVLARAEAMG